MRVNRELCRKCTDRLDHFRDVVPVFRIRERSVDEMETEALRLASRIADRERGSERQERRRREGRSDLLLAEGVRARVFHPSGAMTVKTGLAPFEALIAPDAGRVEREKLVEVARRQADRLGLRRWAQPGERLRFERLWQVKATGMTERGETGPVALCRVVGAFRRYLHDLPVWGRASVFVQVAGDDRIDSVGVDWRPVHPEAIDHVRVLAPEDAAARIVSDLQTRIPGAEMAPDDVDVSMFALGYFSLPKRRSQSALAPVYVAMISTRGWGTLDFLIVTAASELPYESFCRIAQAPPPRISPDSKGPVSRSVGRHPDRREPR